MAISLTPPVITHRAHTSKGKMSPRPQINATKRRSYGADALTAAAWLTVTMKVAGAGTTRRTRPPIFCDDAPGARWVRRVHGAPQFPQSLSLWQEYRALASGGASLAGGGASG